MARVKSCAKPRPGTAKTILRSPATSPLSDAESEAVEKRVADTVRARRALARSPATITSMEPAGLPALQDAIRHLHGVEATCLEAVSVRELHEGRVVWDGVVQVFAVEHPKASRVYAWSHETEGGRRRFHAVLGAAPVDSATDAVRVAIVGEFKRAQN